MTLQEIISAINPSFSLYWVFLTLGVVFFKIAQHFRDNGSRVHERYFTEVKDVKENFIAHHVQPEIAKTLTDAIHAAYEKCSSVLEPESAPGGGAPVEVSVEEARTEILRLKKQDKTAEGFFASKSGEDFLERLGKLQERCRKWETQYKTTQTHGEIAHMSYFVLSVLLFLSLLGLPYPNIALTYKIAYGYFLFFTFCVGFYGAVRHHISESRLRVMLEELGD